MASRSILLVGAAGPDSAPARVAARLRHAIRTVPSVADALALDGADAPHLVVLDAASGGAPARDAGDI
jgi:hypothetical protein